MEAMLAVASYPANAIAEMSYEFWHRLSRCLTTSFGSERPPSLQACAHSGTVMIRNSDAHGLVLFTWSS